MYYYFPEGFTVGVKTQRAWRKQHFFVKSTFWVSTFLPLLSAELWTHVGVRKQYSTIASPNQSVSNESSFPPIRSVMKKFWGGHWKEKGKGTKTYSLPNLIELHSLFIEEQNSSWPMLICSSDEESMLYWIFQCKCLHFMNWVLAKKKEFDERIRLNHSWCKRKYFYFIKEEWRACIY